MAVHINIVSGLPRTGTSLMMKMLEAGGLPVVVDNVREADIDNPGGYYEFEAVKKIKEDASWLDGTGGKVFKMVSMLLYELPPTRRYRIIFMERAMSEVLASQDKMLKRLGREAASDDPDKMRRLYEKHLAEIKDWLGRQENMDVLYVSYNKVMADPRGSALAVAGFLGGGLDAEKMAGVVDKMLYRNRAGGAGQAAGEANAAPLNEKVATALEAIREALAGPGASAVAFGGGKDSVVLLDLVRKASVEGRSLPVLCLDPPSGYPGLYQFIEKIRKLWGLDMVREKAPGRPGGDADAPGHALYPGIEDVVCAAEAHGYARLFTGLRAGEEGVSADAAGVMEYGEVALVNPMLSFTEPDVWEYIGANRLPACSLYAGGTGKLGCLPSSVPRASSARVAADGLEEERLKKSLRSLGYV